MYKEIRNTILIIILATVIVSCGPAKRLSSDEVFLRKNVVKFEEGSSSESILEEDLYPILKQKVNRKILFFRFNLAMYNMVNPEKRAAKHEKKELRVKRRIAINQLKLEEAINGGKKIKKQDRISKRIKKTED